MTRADVKLYCAVYARFFAHPPELNADGLLALPGGDVVFRIDQNSVFKADERDRIYKSNTMLWAQLANMIGCWVVVWHLPIFERLAEESLKRNTERPHLHKSFGMRFVDDCIEFRFHATLLDQIKQKSDSGKGRQARPKPKAGLAHPSHGVPFSFDDTDTAKQ